MTVFVLMEVCSDEPPMVFWSLFSAEEYLRNKCITKEIKPIDYYDCIDIYVKPDRVDTKLWHVYMITPDHLPISEWKDDDSANEEAEFTIHEVDIRQ
jgi:hypothetical protein